MPRPSLLHDIFSAYESAEPTHRADSIDEYRELAILALVWERSSIAPLEAERAPAPVTESPIENAAIGEGHGNHL